MSHDEAGEQAIAVVRRNAEEVQGRGGFELFGKCSPTTSSILGRRRAGRTEAYLHEYHCNAVDVAPSTP
jgi:hypothetical protein